MKKAGRIPKPFNEQRIPLGTSVTIKREHYINKGKAYWAGIIRDFIKSKESEIEKA